MSEKLSKIRQLFYICCLLQIAFIQQLPAIWKQPPVLVSVPFQDVGSDGPVLDVNASNNGLAVWIAPSGSFANVQSSFYTFGSGWSTPEIISSLATNPNRPENRIYVLQADPHDAMNELNYCVAVWEGTQVIPELNDDTILGVFAATRTPDGVWSDVQRMSAFQLSDDGTSSQNPRVAVNDPGLAVSVWNEIRGAGTLIRYTVASTLQMGGIWSTPVDISNAYDSSSNLQDTPDVAINNNGEAVAVWNQNLPPNASGVFSATYNGNTNTWSPPVQLDTAGGFAASDLPHVGIDANGNAVAVWLWTDNVALSRVYSASFTPGFGWGAPTVLASTTFPNSFDSPQIVMDLAGNSTAAWNFYDNNTALSQVFSAKLPLGGTWSVPVPISQLRGFITTGLLSQRPISVDLTGNVIVIYQFEDDAGVESLYSVANFNQVWQTPEFISSSTANPMQFRPSDINIGLGSCGFALSLWAASPYEVDPPRGDIFQVWGSENFGPAPVAPCNLQGNRCHEKFATSSFYVNRLTWTACGAPCTLFYNIYRDGVLIATVPGNVTFYNDPVCNNRAATYTVTGVGLSGVESLPATVVIR